MRVVGDREAADGDITSDCDFVGPCKFPWSPARVWEETLPLEPDATSS